MPDDYQLKVHEPTPKRLRDAKAQGLVPRSHDLSTLMLVLAAGAAMILQGHHIFQFFINMMSHTLGNLPNENITQTFAQSARQSFYIIMPLLILLLAACTVGATLLGGFRFDLSHISLKKIKRTPIWSLNTVVTLLKTVLTFAALIIAISGAIWHCSYDLIGLETIPLHLAIEKAKTIITSASLVFCIILALFTLFDVLYQRWQHRHKLRMSAQELQQELKDSRRRTSTRA